MYLNFHSQQCYQQQQQKVLTANNLHICFNAQKTVFPARSQENLTYVMIPNANTCYFTMQFYNF